MGRLINTDDSFVETYIQIIYFKHAICIVLKMHDDGINIIKII